MQVVVVVVGSRSPSGSLSLAATSMVTGWEAVVVAASADALGSSGTAATVTLTVAVSQAPSVSQTS